MFSSEVSESMLIKIQANKVAIHVRIKIKSPTRIKEVKYNSTKVLSFNCKAMSMYKLKHNGLHLAILIITSIVLALNSGCIERKLYIITNPADCEVYVDGKYIGNTVVRNENDPNTGRIEHSFVYYAEREIVVKKKDFESRSEFIKPSTPWYEIFPIDFFSEILIPYTIHVRFTYRFDLKEYEDMDSDVLLEEGEKMRNHSSEKLRETDE